MTEIECCPYCGRSWEKKKENHWVRKFIETVVATVAVAITAIVLRWIGI
jgi:hypothetical protein